MGETSEERRLCREFLERRGYDLNWNDLSLSALEQMVERVFKSELVDFPAMSLPPEPREGKR